MQIRYAHGGVTQLGYDEQQLRRRLIAAKLQPTTKGSAVVVQDWCRSIDPLVLARQPLPPKADARPSFAGWRPPAIHRPWGMPPVPVDLELAVADDMESPIEELAPWWDQLRLLPLPPPPVQAHLGTRRAEYGAYQDGNWSTGRFENEQKQAQLRLYADRCELQSWWSVTVARIRQSSFASYVLIPGYGPVKDFISFASQRPIIGSHGCRIRHQWVSAVSGRLEYDQPTFGRPENLPSRAVCSITVEFTDGWRPLRIRVVQEGNDAPAIAAFLPVLVDAIAQDRLANPHLGDDDRATITAIRQRPAQLSDWAFDERGYQSHRVELPGWSPICAALDQIQPEAAGGTVERGGSAPRQIAGTGQPVPAGTDTVNVQLGWIPKNGLRGRPKTITMREHLYAFGPSLEPRFIVDSRRENSWDGAITFLGGTNGRGESLAPVYRISLDQVDPSVSHLVLYLKAASAYDLSDYVSARYVVEDERGRGQFARAQFPIASDRPQVLVLRISRTSSGWEVATLSRPLGGSEQDLADFIPRSLRGE